MMSDNDQTDRAQLVRRLALAAGFERVGIATAGPVNRGDYYKGWLDRGCAGEMHYLHRHLDVRVDPRKLLDGARSIIVVAQNYRHDSCSQSGIAEASTSEPVSDARSSTTAEPVRGRIAQYAWGRDYHRVLKKRLRGLADALHEAIGEPFETRVCVDTAPIVEREWAAVAGIGWIGKNTVVLDRQLGSFFFLGEIVTTLELEPSEPATDYCGSCTRCLEACPTGALSAPYQMDASRCIAYLTIEHRGDIPESLQVLMGNWVFGCDVCQEVCPYNRHAPVTQEPAYALHKRHPLPPRPQLDELPAWTEQGYRRNLAGSAIKRATLEMLKRNADIAGRNADR